MLLCLVKGLKCHFLASFFGYGENALSRLLGCGQDREGPLGCEGKLLSGHAQQVRSGPGDGRRIVSRPARMRQPISGPRRPRELVSAGGRPQAGAGLAGDVTLEAADDLLPGRPSLARRPAWARAGGCELSRVITIRHRAWLAPRPPPGPGRWRVTFPGRCGDRGSGAQVRPGGLGAEPPGVVPGGDEQQRRGARGRCRNGRAGPGRGRSRGGR